jgi:hypothetical protein
MEATIYMPLLDEGTDVWRPVRASRDGDVFTVLGPMPEEETWQFPPDSRVLCARKDFAQRQELIAIVLAPIDAT